MSYSIQTISFEKALPVWVNRREKELNLWLSFRAVAKKASSTLLRITGSSAYDVKVNGKFIAFGPARSAHGYFRVDELNLSDEIKADAVITITVAGYNANSYYHIDQPSFLTAELIQDGEITAATGHEGFLCRIMTEHIQKTMRFSLQRTFCEVYELTPSLDAWEKDVNAAWNYKNCALTRTLVQEPKTYIARGSAYNVYDKIPAEKLTSRFTFTLGDYREKLLYPSYIIPRTKEPPHLKEFALGELAVDSLLEARNIDIETITPADETPKTEEISAFHGMICKMPCNTTGKLCFDAVCEENTEILVTFDEYLDKKGLVNFRRLFTISSLIWRLKKGSYHLSTFEPYTMGAMSFFVKKGKVSISNIHMTYFGAEKTARRYNGNDPALEKIFHAAVETYRQNTFTIYMDCPSRERAGWLCDSFFTARVEKLLTGKSEIERVFLENFFLPEGFTALPQGMFAMCYPADQYHGSYIPNWAMWLVLELREYLARTGDRTLVDNAKPRIDALLRFFKGYENADGLLEKLDQWVFVEWSKANELTQDVNFPSNMLYAMMLEAAAELYGDDALREKAVAIHAYINENAVMEDGFYCDNAVYDENGELRLSGECTETCQYYAFFCGTATPETKPTLWRRLVEDFGPERVVPHEWPKLKDDAKWQKVYASNAFIGNYLRLELLYLHGEHKRLIDNIRGFFIKMAKLTGTLWENETPTASCNHGFASHVLYWMEGLGLLD